MALQIKEGVEIYAYGPGCDAFTSETKLSQAILEHLQSKFQEEIEEVETKEIKKAK